jgi:GDP-4-dehydro-6-deoxy-D-mannose reductase
MKILITGMTGFIGRYLTEALLAEGNEIVGTGYQESERRLLSPELQKVPLSFVDMRDRNKIEKIVESTKPDCIYHLAGQAYVIPSFRDPATTFEVNVLGTVYLLEAVRGSCPQSSVAVACSGAEYGLPRKLPISEDQPLEPVSPYGVSKAAQDLLAHQYHESHALNTFRLRLFSTTGPGKMGDAPNDFASQIARIEADGGRGVMHVGDLSTARDISDVRDTVGAMRAVVDRGTPGEAYNLGRGAPVAIREVLDRLLAQSRAEIEVRTAKERLRPADERILFPDVTKLRALDWEPTFPLEDTLHDLLEFWRTHLELVPKEAAAR